MSETNKDLAVLNALRHVTVGLTLALSAGLIGAFGALADGELSLKNISVNPSKQLVVEFVAGGGAPQAPTLTEAPSPNHQLLVDFANVSLDDNSALAGDLLSKQLRTQLPGVKAARVGVLTNAAVPTVRLAIDLDDGLAIKPTVTDLHDGAAVISFGDDYTVQASGGSAAVADVPSTVQGSVPAAAQVAVQAASAEAAATDAAINAASGTAGGAATATPAASASTDPAAAYEEYYRKFLQQKQMVSKESKIGDWGARKGTADEMKGVNKKGVRIIGTPIDSPALAAVPDAPALVEETPKVVAKRKVVAPPVEAPAESAAAPEPAAAAAPEPAAAAAPEPAAAAAPEPAAAAAPVAVAESAAAQEPAATAAQPDMVAGEEPASAAAPAAAKAEEESAAEEAPKKVAAVAPSAEAPTVRKLHAKQPVSVEEAPDMTDSAAAPGDAAAATLGAAGNAIKQLHEQDKPENQSHVTSPADEDNVAPAAETPRHKASRMYNEARKNHLAGRVDQAISGYKAAIKVDPELCEAHSDLGLAYNQQHNYGQALIEFHKALAINPKDAYTYNNVGAALRAQHDNEAAIKNWETAVKIDPKLAAAHYNLGTAYEAEGDLDRALVSYEEAVKIDQRLGEAFFRIGIIMQDRHRLSDARTNFRKSLKVSADADYSEEARTRIARLDKAIAK